MILWLLDRPLRHASLAVLAFGTGTWLGTWLHLWWTEGDL